MYRQLTLFFTALTFLTRLPAPIRLEFDSQSLNQSSRYFPWVGLVVGSIYAGVFLMSEPWFGGIIAAILATIAGVLCTGAFHEDGFADFCDGFGGGWHKEQVLSIMKDSRIGTYGAVGLGLMLALKTLLIAALPLSEAAVAIVAAHVISRFIATSITYNYPYAQLDSLSKVKPLAQQITLAELGIAALPTVVCLGVLPWQTSASICALLMVGRGVFSRYLTRRIGGYTGDCLGAAQQLSEACCYLVLVAYWGTPTS